MPDQPAETADPAEVRNAIHITARHLIEHIIVREIEYRQLWMDYGPEIGEWDWEMVEATALELVRASKVSQREADDAYELLAARASAEA